MQPTQFSISGEAELPWYALHVKPRHEKVVSFALQQKGISEYLPVYRVKRHWSDRVRESEAPLFPGYVFCQLDWQRRVIPVLTTPGVLRVVGVGKVPAPVNSSELDAVRAIVNSGVYPCPWPMPKLGDLVFLEDGPLRGLEGLLIRSKGQTRFVASVTLLQRAVAVEVEASWARPLTGHNVADRPRSAPCSAGAPLPICG